jgi:hypothetical protein
MGGPDNGGCREDEAISSQQLVYSVLQIISEVGTDLSKRPTEKRFTAWMRLAPGTRQSGKRHANVKRSRNRVGKLFCIMARSLARSNDIALSGFYSRLAARRGDWLPILPWLESSLHCFGVSW